MFILAKQIDEELIIIGSAQKKISTQGMEQSGIQVFEIPDNEYTPNMLHSKIDSYEEVL